MIVSRTRHDFRKYKHTKIEREILAGANKHLAEMREEFLKSDFHLPNAEKPVEFEMKDYDKAVKESKHPQLPPEQQPKVSEETPQEIPQKEEPKPNPMKETSDPEITEDPSPITTESTTPPDSKTSLAKRRLDTGLDGNYWQYTETHGRRLRVKTTKLQKEEEFWDSWDNTINMDEPIAEGERLTKED